MSVIAGMAWYPLEYHPSLFHIDYVSYPPDDPAYDTAVIPGSFEAGQVLYPSLMPVSRICPSPSALDVPPAGMGVPSGARMIELRGQFEVSEDILPEGVTVDPTTVATQDIYLRVPDYDVVMVMPSFVSTYNRVCATWIDGTLKERRRGKFMYDAFYALHDATLRYVHDPVSVQFSGWTYNAAYVILTANTWMHIQQSAILKGAIHLQDNNSFDLYMWPIADEVPTAWQTEPENVRVQIRNA